MNSSIAKKTQDSLGKIIGKKPPLTEKLLNRPPFRFLHDVLTSVSRQTGFMKGLYTEAEASSDTINSKDGKIAYLQKAIDYVVYTTGEKLSVRPSKIVAGLEAEKTNEFLQALAAACNSKPDNDAAVKAVLGGEKQSNKESRSERERSADKRKSREKSDKSEKIEEKAEEEENKEKEENKDRGDRDRKHRDRESSRDGKRESSRHRDRGESSKGERGERPKNRESSRNRSDEKDGNKSREKSASERDREGRKDKDDKKERSSRRHRDEQKSTPVTNGEDENEKKESSAADPEGYGEEEPTANRIPRPSSAKGSRRRHREDEDDTQKDEESQPTQPDQQPSQQKRLLRPASARPAPPKVKRSDGIQDTLHDRIDSGTRRVENVIVDQANHSEDEDNNFTVEENNIPAEPITAEQEPVNMSTTDDGEHGGLVKKILESKKEFDNSQSQQSKTKIEKSNVNDATRHKEREMVKKEVDKLRSSIQTLTRSANPLGKVMDYVQEDLHSMQKERDSWKQENRTLQGEIERELKVTGSSIEPLKSILSQLEQAVSDQLDLIAAAKHKITDNDEKIYKMLSSISQG